jgi:uncharacterized protein YbjT (DUF2867 family)
VVQQLRDDGIPVRAMTRNPATITPTEQVDAVLGDFQDPATTAAGLHGVDAIFVMSPVASIVDHTKIAVDVARRKSGVLPWQKARFTVRDVLGRPPQTFARWVEANGAAFL